MFVQYYIIFNCNNVKCGKKQQNKHDKSFSALHAKIMHTTHANYNASVCTVLLNTSLTVKWGGGGGVIESKQSQYCNSKIKINSI